MKQSTVIFVALLVAFVIYITIRGQLPEYFSLFTGANSAPETKESGATDSLSDWQKTLENFDNLFSTMRIK